MHGYRTALAVCATASLAAALITLLLPGSRDPLPPLRPDTPTHAAHNAEREAKMNLQRPSKIPGRYVST